jgi:hypothetical protein
MKRAVLPASALVLVVTACGAGAKPTPQATEVGARPQTVRALVAQRNAFSAFSAGDSFGRIASTPKG